MTLVRIRSLTIALVLILLAGGSGYLWGKYQFHSYADVLEGVESELSLKDQTIDRSQPQDHNVDMDQFWQVWDMLEDEFLFKDKVNYQQMVHGAIAGMTASLEDPYTVFLPPQKNKTTKENLSGAFFGVGIQLGYKTGTNLAVIAPIAGMPAEKAGVKAGDYILHIKDDTKDIDVDTIGMSLIEAVEIIRGQKDTSVILTLLHDGGDEPFDATIKREEIIVPSVEVEFGQVFDHVFSTEATGSGELVAWLKLTRFGDKTDEQWDESVAKILEKETELAGIVLDLRNNPGGYLQGAINLAGEFLPMGKVIVKQEHSQMPTQDFAVNRFGRLQDIPVVVLINQGSASASEILAGALREHNRAKLVGAKSFGKGTIQADEGFTDGSSLHVTIAQWLTPQGNWIHENGLEPDTGIAFDEAKPEIDTQLAGAAELLLGTFERDVFPQPTNSPKVTSKEEPTD